jgi:hypothetical protein
MNGYAKSASIVHVDIPEHYLVSSAESNFKGKKYGLNDVDLL